MNSSFRIPSAERDSAFFVWYEGGCVSIFAQQMTILYIKKMNKILCLLLFAVAGVASAEEIKIDVTAQGQPLNHYWSVGTCAGRVNEGLRTSWVEQLRTVHDECGFQYLRMHGLFDDDMCVYFEDRKGQPHLQLAVPRRGI